MAKEFRRGGLSTSEQTIVTESFDAHTEKKHAPQYNKEPVSWLVRDEHEELAAVLTAETLWDWMYIDELWVSARHRGGGMGTRLMQLAEEFAESQSLQGTWLWTQSWQAGQFYRKPGYSEFTRFDNFPKGHSRIGFRKLLGESA